MNVPILRMEQEVMCSAGMRIKPAAKDHSEEDLEEATQRRYSLAEKQTKCSAGRRIKPAARITQGRIHGDNVDWGLTQLCSNGGFREWNTTQRRYSLAEKITYSSEKDSTDNRIQCAGNKLSSSGTRVL